jgi:hypothetical protein
MDEEDKLSYYIEIGAVEVKGLDNNGEFIFAVTPQAKDIAPELWDIHKSFVDETLVDLFEKDLINVIYDENLNASFEITEEGRELLEEMGIYQIPDEY